MPKIAYEEGSIGKLPHLSPGCIDQQANIDVGLPTLRQATGHHHRHYRLQ